MSDNNVVAFPPPRLSRSEEAACYTIWLRLDNTGFAPVVDGGILHLQDRHDPPRTVTQLAFDPEAAQVIHQVAEVGAAVFAAYVEQEAGQLRQVSFDADPA